MKGFNMELSDTIAAIATPPGAGGIGIIRISGPDSERILNEIFVPADPSAMPMKSHRLIYGSVTDGEERLDECMAVLMRAPHSYTREDVGELQLHGSTFILTDILKLCVTHGARIAEAGEFTKRAFINGRIDLSQAEAVMRLISSRSEKERRSAIRQMEGGATSFARSIADELYSLQAGLAACIDYPEEISEEEGAGDLKTGIENVLKRIESETDEHSSRLLNDGYRVVLAGSPNVGKSSLLNSLLGEDRAIVTHIPGTTRDLIQGETVLNGIRIIITDTAGIRATEDPVEKIGVGRSERAIEEADLVFLVLDGSENLKENDLLLLRSLKKDRAVIINKSDLDLRINPDDLSNMIPDIAVLTVSAFDHESLDPVKKIISEKASASDMISVSQPRHIAALKSASAILRGALKAISSSPLDLIAIDLRKAQEAIGEITGDSIDEKMLDSIFSQFCVGK